MGTQRAQNIGNAERVGRVVIVGAALALLVPTIVAVVLVAAGR